MGYDLDILRENLKKIRTNSGMSIYDLEKKLAWQHSTIFSYETARTIPKMNYVIDFCNYFKISIEDLFKKEL